MSAPDIDRRPTCTAPAGPWRAPVWAAAWLSLCLACGGEESGVAKIVVGDPPSTSGDVVAAGEDTPKRNPVDAGAIDAGGIGGQDGAGPADAPALDDAPASEDAAPTDTAPTDTAPPIADVGGQVDAAGAGCATDADCPSPLHCDNAVPGGACVQCLYASQCQGTYPSCNGGKCGQKPACTGDKDCAAYDMVCNAAAGHCVPCLADGDCQAGWVCKASTCLPPPTVCQSSKACAELGQVCDKQLGACVDCLDAADCDPKEYCEQGVCLPDVCPPGAQVCDNVSVALTCLASGAGWALNTCPQGQACADGKCQAVVCAPGATKCVGDAVATCDPMGVAYGSPVPCKAGEFCQGGACGVKTCAAGEQKCVQTEIWTCAAGGAGWSKEACPAGKTCDAFQGVALCVPQKCAPSSPFCQDGKAMLCAADGLNAAIAKNCADLGQACQDGACVVDACTPGAQSCKFGKLAVCDKSGKAWVVQACPGDQVCKQGVCGPAGPCTATAPPASQPVQADVIVLLDTSGSMGEETKLTSKAIVDLAGAMTARGVDHRIVLVGKSSGCCQICVPPPVGGPNCSDGPAFKQVKTAVGSTNALSQAVASYSVFQAFLRQEAEKHFVVISDDDSAKPASWFTAELAKLKNPGFPEGFVLHAVVAQGSVPNKGCSTGAKIGKVYIELAGKTGGKSHPICESDAQVWSGWFGGIGEAVAKGGNACAYPLPEAAKNKADLTQSLKIFLSVGGTKTPLSPAAAAASCGTSLGYTLAGDTITLCPAACKVAAGATLALEFACN